MKNELKNITVNQTPIEIALGIDKNGMTTARKLYDFLELSKGQFSRWAKTNITENEFATEQEDYWGFDINVEGNITQDFKLTANFAKKLSMTQKNGKGEQARNYFIKVEDKLKEVVKQEKISLKEQLEAAAFVAEDLHVPQSNKIMMFRKVCENNHINSNFLPSYSRNEDREAKTATALLKQFQCEIKIREFNERMIKAGYLEERERDTSNRKRHPSGKKPFKALTEKGLKYGKNLTSDKNTKETQPYYYVDTFLELYHFVMQEVL